MSLDNLLPLDVAASKLGVSVWTLKRWIKAGKLAEVRLGDRTRRVTTQALEAMIAEAEKRRTP